MALEGFGPDEVKFVEQRHEFLELARSRYPSCPTDVQDLLAQPPAPLEPILVDTLDGLTDDDSEAVASALAAGYGVVHLVPRAFQLPLPGEPHPLLALAARLHSQVQIGYPVDHPMEGHREAEARFGPRDGTLKIYDLPVEPGGPRYREQAETNETFDSHNDGLGYAGLIRTVIFVLDSPPLSGGYTYFQNLVRAAPALARTDEEAFAALFLPDAIRAVRPRGKGAIKVTSPVLFLGGDGSPQVFFRVTTGEYRIEWRRHDALRRARLLLERLAQPFAPHSRFVHLVRPGETVVIDNRHVVHGRTPFIDPPNERGRVLARKWFVANEGDAIYRHVPAVCVDERWAQFFPQQFAPDRLVGDWHYDETTDENVRVSR